MTERELISLGFTPHGDGTLHSPARITLTPAGGFYRVSIELPSGEILRCSSRAQSLQGREAMSEHANREQAIHTLRTQLIECCLDEDAPVVTAALFQVLMLAIVCGAPTLDEAKATLKGTLERAERGMDSAWATYKRTEQ